MPCHFEKIMKRLDRKRASSHGSREASLHLLSPSLGPALGRIHLVVVENGGTAFYDQLARQDALPRGMDCKGRESGKEGTLISR